MGRKLPTLYGPTEAVMPNQNDIRLAITNEIIRALESGNVPPWRRPWKLGKNAGAHANVVTERSYRGLNPILLDIASEKHGFSSKWWGTYRQWTQQIGGRVMPRPSHVPSGKWGTQVVFWSPVKKKVENDQGDLEDDKFFVLRLYTIFNIDQVEGLDHLRAGQSDTSDSNLIDYQPAEEALETSLLGMRLDLRYGGAKAFYSPTLDYVQIPPKSTFESLKEYYGTVFHELVHATEHESRLNWSRKSRENAYAHGELIAELGGVMVSRELGVPASDDLTNHVAYLKSWLQAMKNDSRFIIMASAQASKAASYILSFSRKEEEAVEAECELISA
jgi:antirestriction protein ArdC